MKKKEFLTYDEQIAFLKDKKNLQILDEEYAKWLSGHLSLRLFRQEKDCNSEYVENHERLSLPRESRRYMYWKNDVFAQLIILNLLLPQLDIQELIQ